MQSTPPSTCSLLCSWSGQWQSQRHKTPSPTGKGSKHAILIIMLLCFHRFEFRKHKVLQLAALECHSYKEKMIVMQYIKHKLLSQFLPKMITERLLLNFSFENYSQKLGEISIFYIFYKMRAACWFRCSWEYLCFYPAVEVILPTKVESFPVWKSYGCLGSPK